MPEPLAAPSTTAAALWPIALPQPQAASIQMSAPARVRSNDVLSGPTRRTLNARTAPPEWAFSLWLTNVQMQVFEQWYRDCIAANDGEFYVPWIGGSRVVAFAAPYEYTAQGTGWELQCRVIRTRIDPSVCDAYINAVFGAILRDDGASADIVRDDGASSTIIADDYSLTLIADNGC